MICLTHMFIEVYLLIQVALIPVMVKEFQLSLLEASLVATIPSLASLLMNLPSGFLADRFSTHHLLSASMLIEGGAAFLVSQTRDFPTLLVGVSLMRLSSPIYHISGLSQMSRLAEPKQMSRSVGIHNALGNVGTAGGLVTLTVFLSSLGWRWTYLFWALPIIVWGFVVFKSPSLRIAQPNKPNYQRNGLGRYGLILTSGLVLFLIVISIREVGATGASTFMTTFFVNGRGLSDSAASLIYSLGPFVGILGSLGGGYLSERLGARKALGWTVLGCALSLLAISFVTQAYMLALMFSFYSIFNNAVWSPMNTTVANLTPASERGLSYSVYFFTEGLVASMTPTLVAGFVELTDIWYVFPLSVVFLIVSLIALQLFLGRSGRSNF
jgi:MFS family permease